EEARLPPIMFPREYRQHSPLHSEQGKRKKTCQDLIGDLGMIAEPTGTNGCRMLCRQFYTSSFLHLGHFIKRCSTFLLRMNQMCKAIMLFLSTDDQDRNIRTMVFLLNFGRQLSIVWWSRKNRSVP